MGCGGLGSAGERSSRLFSCAEVLHTHVNVANAFLDLIVRVAQFSENKSFCSVSKAACREFANCGHIYQSFLSESVKLALVFGALFPCQPSLETLNFLKAPGETERNTATAHINVSYVHPEVHALLELGRFFVQRPFITSRHHGLYMNVCVLTHSLMLIFKKHLLVA